MKKILSIFVLAINLFIPKSERVIYHDIQLSFKDSVEIKLIVNNEYFVYSKGSRRYNEILYEFDKLVEGSHQMPAFSVSIDELTRKEMEMGVWLEFVFDGVGYNSEMPFETLLVQTKRDYYGFNIIRKYNDKYDGRCFYVSLNDKNMDSLYVYLINYSK